MALISDFLNRFMGQHGQWQRTVAFVLCGLVITIALPDVGQFKLDFHRGMPWMHEDLVAPFDFAIQKPKGAYEAELTAARNRALPCLRRDTLAELGALSRFQSALLNTMAVDTTVASGKRAFVQQRKAGELVLNDLFARGIVLQSKETANLKVSDTIMVMRGQMAEERQLGDLYTASEAYEEAMIMLESDPDAESELLGPVIANALVQNLRYDASTTQGILDLELNGVSSTRGVVPEGLSVIKRGEMVDSEKLLILESLRSEYGTKLGSTSNRWMVRLGHAIVTGICLLILFLFLERFRPNVFASGRQVAFILLTLSTTVIIVLIVRKVTRLDLYMVPFCLVPVVIRSFFDTRVALFTHLIGLVIVSFHAPNSYEFMFLELMAGIMALFTLTDMHNRSRLFLSLIMVFLVYAIGYIGVTAMQEGTLIDINLDNMLWFGASVGLTLFAYPIIFISEKTFGFVSDLTLLELSNTNHPLLRRLAAEAPGTFQHSLQVANLAETAVFEIGGNALLVRTGALFHDIGKIEAPNYFIENQLGGMNPHDDMPFEESAAIIIGHVKKGLALAKKHDLPEQITDFIRTHHGTSTVQYFYRSFLRQYPELEPDTAKFTYPGPKPWTREMAVLMMADSVEAASRSLKVYDTDSVIGLVDKIIDHQLKDGQLNEAEITLAEINRVRKLFKAKLLNIYHVRKEYPD